MSETETQTCKGLRANGEQCTSKVLLANGYCVMHQDQAKEVMEEDTERVSFSMTFTQIDDSETEPVQPEDEDDQGIVIVDESEWGLESLDDVEVVLPGEEAEEVEHEPEQAPEKAEKPVKKAKGRRRKEPKETKPKEKATKTVGIRTRRSEATFVEYQGFPNIRRLEYSYGVDYKEPNQKGRYSRQAQEAFRDTNGRVFVKEIRNDLGGIIRREVIAETPAGQTLITTVLNGGKADKRAKGWSRALNLAYDRAQDWVIDRVPGGRD